MKKATFIRPFITYSLANCPQKGQRKTFMRSIIILAYFFLFVNVLNMLFVNVSSLNAAWLSSHTTSSRANSLRMGVNSNWETAFSRLNLNGPLDYGTRCNGYYHSYHSRQFNRPRAVPQRLQHLPRNQEDTSEALQNSIYSDSLYPDQDSYDGIIYEGPLQEGIVYEGAMYDGVVYEDSYREIYGELIQSSEFGENVNYPSDPSGQPKSPTYLKIPNVPTQPTPLSSLEIDGNTLYQYHYLGQSGRRTVSRFAPLQLWTQGYYNDTDVEADGNSTSYDIKRHGVLVGAYQPLGRHSAFGVMIGYSDPVLKQHNARWTANDFQFALYGGTYIHHKYELKGFLGFGYQDYTMKRTIGNQVRGGRTNSDSFAMSFQLARPFFRPRTGLWKPYIAIDLNNVDQDAFREYGANYMYQYDKASYTRTAFRVGINYEYESNCWKFRGGLAYSVKIAGDSATDTTGTYFYPGLSFRSRDQGVSVGNDFFNANLGVERYINNLRTKSLYVDYNIHTSNKETDYSVALGLRWIL